MKKKITALFLALSMVLTGFGLVPASAFSAGENIAQK